MQLAFHLGCHATDEGKLVRSILRSRDVLLAHGIHVPGPRRYRNILPDTLGVLHGSVATDDAQKLLLGSVLDSEDAERALFFHENLISAPSQVFSDEGLYATAPGQFAALVSLFPSHETEFTMALCNPATLIPSLMQRARMPDLGALVTPENAKRLRWLPTMERVMERNPGLKLTLWCNEDTPLLWPEVLRALTKLGHDTPHEGDLDMVAALLPPDGFAELTQDMINDPPPSIPAWRQRIVDALEDYRNPELMEIAVTLPGWTQEVIDEVTETYFADCAAIAALPGVTFLDQ